MNKGGGLGINWGFAETYGICNSFIREVTQLELQVRMSEEELFLTGMHVFLMQNNGKGHIPLSKIANNHNTRFDIYDSLLSEEAVLSL